jgi:hypothetical protein
MLSGSTAGVCAEEAGLAGDSQKCSEGHKSQRTICWHKMPRVQQTRECRCLEAVVYPVV